MNTAPKAAVITFPGSNCDQDVIYALDLMGFKVGHYWHKDKPNLSTYDLVVLPGGFSYGDYLRCGAMAALAPIQDRVHEHVEKGKLLLGICNGFQILCEMKLLPGGLVRNREMKFLSTDIHLKVENYQTAWTNSSKEGQSWRIPIAHGDGRYVCTAPELEALKKNKQIVLRYTDDKGTTPPTAGYPYNGSTDAIAGVMNAKGNVFGLMPHPERATDLRSREGRYLWQSVLKHLGARS